MSNYVDSRKEIQSQINKVSALIAADGEKLANQEKIIARQNEIIAKQREVISHVRNELIEMKKQMLINEARATPKDFRDNLQKYLLDLRTELIALSQSNKSDGIDPCTQFGKRMEIKMNDDDEKKDMFLFEAEISKSAITALYIAAGRAIESKRGGKDRLFYDEYADKFASINNNSGYKFIESFAKKLTELNFANDVHNEITTSYLAMFVGFRTKWIDDSIYHCLQKDKERMRSGKTKGTIKQILVFGAGADTRPFRLTKLPKDLKIYNIDKIDMIKLRKRIFKNDFPNCKYIDIESELNDNKWIDKLIENGFNINKKSIIVCEGVLEYFPYDTMIKLLQDISSNVCCVGSWIIGEMPNGINISLKEMHDIWV